MWKLFMQIFLVFQFFCSFGWINILVCCGRASAGAQIAPTESLDYYSNYDDEVVITGPAYGSKACTAEEARSYVCLSGVCHVQVLYFPHNDTVVQRMNSSIHCICHSYYEGQFCQYFNIILMGNFGFIGIGLIAFIIVLIFVVGIIICWNRRKARRQRLDHRPSRHSGNLERVAMLDDVDNREGLRRSQSGVNGSRGYTAAPPATESYQTAQNGINGHANKIYWPPTVASVYGDVGSNPFQHNARNDVHGDVELKDLNTQRNDHIQ